MSRTPLSAALRRSLEALQPGPLCVAYSGGMDSTLLLTLLAAECARQSRPLRAIHVDHQLHVDSPHWAEHCTRQASELGVAVKVVRVDARPASGQSPEDAARQARYRAFSELLADDDILATAHHQDDQAETLLLRLLRGAGTRGLSGMSPLRRLTRGWLWRPWLDVALQDIRKQAESMGLDWIEDPSNQSMYFDRNRLRQHVIPLLRQRWPDAGRQLARSAAHLRGMQQIVQQRVAQELAMLRGLDPRTLDHRRWLALDDALRPLLLSAWLESLGHTLPPPKALKQLDAWRDARIDGEHTLCWANGCLKLWRGQLHALTDLQRNPPAAWVLSWTQGSSLSLPGGLGTLQLQGGDASQLGSLQISSRQGGERMQLQRTRPRRELRLLFQESGIAPWLRALLPLVHHQGELVAVGTLWSSDSFAQTLAAQGMRLHWLDAPEPFTAPSNAEVWQ